MTRKNESVKIAADLSFEDAMAKLEETVRSMESGNEKLDDMIRKFEESRALADFCQKKLNTLEQKIRLLTRDPADGDAQWSDVSTEGIAESKNDFLESAEPVRRPASEPAASSSDDLPF